jgi:protein TonB
VTGCEIARSSGFPDLDTTTCRLIVERFRFKPSRDPAGRPVPATIVQNHSWVIHQLPPEEEREGRQP